MIPFLGLGAALGGFLSSYIVRTQVASAVSLIGTTWLFGCAGAFASVPQGVRVILRQPQSALVLGFALLLYSLLAVAVVGLVAHLSSVVIDFVSGKVRTDEGVQSHSDESGVGGSAWTGKGQTGLGERDRFDES